MVLLKSDRAITHFADPKMGWSEFVNVEPLVPGWHADMFQEGADLIAEHLRPLLHRVDAERDRLAGKMTDGAVHYNRIHYTSRSVGCWNARK